MTPWHVDTELLTRYAGGRLDHTGQAAVESHLVTCADCRAGAVAAVPVGALEPVWQGVADQIAAPPIPLPLRVLRGSGVPVDDLIILRATANIQIPWLLAVASALVFTIAAGALSVEQQLVAYALLTPLLPSILVVASYDATDPLRDVMAATPFSKVRVALLRAALAIGSALPLAVVMGLFVPGLKGQWGAWLLPALALTLTSLVLLTWFSAAVTAGVVSACWLAVIGALRAGNSLELASRSDVQAVIVVVTLLTAAAALMRLTSTTSQGGPA